MMQVRQQISHPLQDPSLFKTPDGPHSPSSDTQNPRDLNTPDIFPFKTMSHLIWKRSFEIGILLSGIVIGTALSLKRQNPRDLNLSRVSLIQNTMSNLPWKRLFKIGIILSGTVIGAVFIDDLFRIKFEQNSHSNDGSDILNQSSQNQGKTEEKIPCVVKMEPYSLDIDGDCAKEEIEKAKSSYKLFMENHDKQIKEETAKEVEEELRKFDERFAPILKRLKAHETERKESERRRSNPTREEMEEDERDSIREAVKDSPFMEPFFRAKYPQYFDALPAETETCQEACQLTARKVLQVSAGATCQEIKKQYHALSLKTHPDKNPRSDTSEFLVISEAYKQLCP